LTLVLGVEVWWLIEVEVVEVWWLIEVEVVEVWWLMEAEWLWGSMTEEM
jgi:hypothetical protein